MRIKHESRMQYLGVWGDEGEAARVWDAAAVRLRGPSFANLNFPDRRGALIQRCLEDGTWAAWDQGALLDELRAARDEGVEFELSHEAEAAMQGGRGSTLPLASSGGAAAAPYVSGDGAAAVGRTPLSSGKRRGSAAGSAALTSSPGHRRAKSAREEDPEDSSFNPSSGRPHSLGGGATGRRGRGSAKEPRFFGPSGGDGDEDEGGSGAFEEGDILMGGGVSAMPASAFGSHAPKPYARPSLQLDHHHHPSSAGGNIVSGGGVHSPSGLTVAQLTPSPLPAFSHGFSPASGKQQQQQQRSSKRSHGSGHRPSFMAPLSVTPVGQTGPGSRGASRGADGQASSNSGGTYQGHGEGAPYSSRQSSPGAFDFGCFAVSRPPTPGVAMQRDASLAALMSAVRVASPAGSAGGLASAATGAAAALGTPGFRSRGGTSHPLHPGDESASGDGTLERFDDLAWPDLHEYGSAAGGAGAIPKPRPAPPGRVGSTGTASVTGPGNAATQSQPQLQPLSQCSKLQGVLDLYQSMTAAGMAVPPALHQALEAVQSSVAAAAAAAAAAVSSCGSAAPSEAGYSDGHLPFYSRLLPLVTSSSAGSATEDGGPPCSELQQQQHGSSVLSPLGALARAMSHHSTENSSAEGGAGLFGGSQHAFGARASGTGYSSGRLLQPSLGDAFALRGPTSTSTAFTQRDSQLQRGYQLLPIADPSPVFGSTAGPATGAFPGLTADVPGSLPQLPSFPDFGALLALSALGGDSGPQSASSYSTNTGASRNRGLVLTMGDAGAACAGRRNGNGTPSFLSAGSSSSATGVMGAAAVAGLGTSVAECTCAATVPAAVPVPGMRGS